MTKNMTQGNPMKVIFAFSFPMLLGGIFQQIYNITDALVLGNFVGSRALAAVGATGSATFFLLAVASGLTNAFAIVIAQYFGAGDEKKVRRTTAGTIYIMAAAGIILSLAGIFGARPLMELLQVPEDIRDQSVVYIRICVGGSAGQIVYNGAASILRAVGDSRTPLYFLILRYSMWEWMSCLSQYCIWEWQVRQRPPFYHSLQQPFCVWFIFTEDLQFSDCIGKISGRS